MYKTERLELKWRSFQQREARRKNKDTLEKKAILRKTEVF